MSLLPLASPFLWFYLVVGLVVSVVYSLYLKLFPKNALPKELPWVVTGSRPGLFSAYRMVKLSSARLRQLLDEGYYQVGIRNAELSDRLRPLTGEIQYSKREKPFVVPK